jgi:hypothetical protein
MKSKTITTYDWIEDVGPIILKNLNELLIRDGIEPLDTLHGGYFKDGKWVGALESRDYRNYWHVYTELFGENLHNDSYQVVYFPHPDTDEEWDYLYELAEKFAKNSTHEHSDMKWPRHLVTAIRKMCLNNLPIDDLDGSRIVFWWSW